MQGVSKHTVTFFRTAMLGILLAAAFTAGSQSIEATLLPDSNHILIGDQLHVKFMLRYSKGMKASMPVFRDSVGNMDFVSASKIDTGVSGNTITMMQTVVVSAYDSGTFHAGPVMVP